MAFPCLQPLWGSPSGGDFPTGHLGGGRVMAFPPATFSLVGGGSPPIPRCHGGREKAPPPILLLAFYFIFFSLFIVIINISTNLKKVTYLN